MANERFPLDKGKNQMEISKTQTSLTSGRRPTSQSKSTTTPRRCNLRCFYAILRNRNLTSREREFLFVLCVWADDHGVCWPSVAAILQILGCCERTVQSIQAGLERKHELEIDYGASPLGTNMLRICCAGGPALAQKKAAGRGANSGRPKPKPAPKVIKTSPSNKIPVPDPVPVPKDPSDSLSTAAAVPHPFPITDELREWAAAKAPKVDLERFTTNFELKHGEGGDYAGIRLARAAWVVRWKSWAQMETRIVKKTAKAGIRIGDRITRFPPDPEPELIVRATAEDHAEWQDILDAVEKATNVQTFNTWYKPMRTALCKRDALAFYVAVPNQTFQDWLNDHVDDVLVAARELGLGEICVVWVKGKIKTEV